ncbi:MAG: DUF4388 domain-containing protein [Myxococcota bacterium]
MEHTYRLRDGDGGVVGPLGFNAVRDLLRAGAIGADAEVARGDGPFSQIKRLKEFDCIFDRLGLRGGGSLEKMGFALLLYRLHRQRASGRLEVRRGNDYKIIYLEKGGPVFLKSNQPKERFGQYLLGQGLLDQHELRVALESMHVDQNRLVDTLLRLGLLDAGDLAVALREQQVSRLVDLCRWMDGEYDWMPDDLFEGDYMPLSIDVPQLIGQASRSLDDFELNQRLAPFLPRRLKVTHTETLGELHLGPVEKRIANHLFGKNTGVQVLNEFGVDDERRLTILRCLFLLHQTDHLGW